MEGAPRPPRIVVVLAIVITAGVMVMAIPPVRHALGTSLVLLGSGQLLQFRQHLRSLGAWAPVTSIVLLASASLLVPVPATIVIAANGVAFGAWIGGLISLGGTLLGAAAAYALGRSVGRPIAERFVPAGALAAAERALQRSPWALILAQLIPGMPGDPMSFAAGIARVPLATFLPFTAIGMAPACFAAAFAGSTIARDIPVVYWVAGWAVVVVGIVLWRWLRRPA